MLRLARFNTFLEDPDRPAWASNYFTGVPAPMGAALVLLPMLLSFQFDTAFFREPAVVSVVLVAVSALLISRIPTFAFKKFKVQNRMVLPMMLGIGFYAILLINAPWMTASATLIVYLAMMPLGVRSYRRMAARTAQGAAAVAVDDDDEEEDEEEEEEETDTAR